MMRTQLFDTMKSVMALTALALIPLNVHGQTTPRYSATNLGTVISSSENDSVYAVSNDGAKVVGQATVTGTACNFYWDGTMHKIASYTPGTSGTRPLAVTTSGVVLLGTYPGSVWTLAGGQTPLSGPTGAASTVDMNDAGVVIGSGPTTTILGYSSVDGTPTYARIALRWSKAPSTGAWNYIPLQPLAGDSNSYALRIDADGNIIGKSFNVDPSTGQLISNVAVRWSLGDGFQPHNVGPLNLRSSIRGIAVDSSLNTRYVWSEASAGYYTDMYGTTQLPQPSSPNLQNTPVGLNASGLVAGVANYGAYQHAYAWTSGVQIDLGVLSGMTSSALSQDIYSRPVNSSGFIVGWSASDTNSLAILSTSRATSVKILDLNLLLSNTLTSVGLSSLRQAININDGGFITCVGVTPADKHGIAYRRAVLLKPVP